MTSVMKIAFICLVGTTCIYLVPPCASLPGIQLSFNSTVLSNVIIHCIEKAVNELSARKQKNLRLFRSGNDRKLSKGYLWHHSLFMSVADPGKVSQLSEKAYIALRATKELVKMTDTSLELLQLNPAVVSIWRKHMAPHCNLPIPKCNPEDQYRTIDGTCNNLANPSWGAAMKPQLRYLPAAFADGVNKPRMYSVTGKRLPSARVVSNILHSDGTCQLNDRGNSVILMSWGQFTDHDIIATPMTRGFNDSDIMCCSSVESRTDKRDPCFPIKIPRNDPRFKEKCMNFVRSSTAPTDYCDIGVRNPLNQQTSFIDGSQIYGSTPELQKRLRTFSGGLLKTNQLDLLPPTDENECMTLSPREHCFDAGDDRVTEVPSLSVFHVLFLREHNRICDKLSYYNPSWTDERIFQEARKIIAAMLQHVTFNEYLPRVLGQFNMLVHGLYSSPTGHQTVYNPNVNPTTANGFGAAAFRFGHSLIPNIQGHLVPRTHCLRTLPVEDTFNRPNMIFESNGKGNLWNAYWQLNTLHARQDRILNDGVRNNLFLDKKGKSLDLASLNIQRGRDHGVPSYNAWRKWCGLKPAIHFGTGEGGLINHDPKTARLLSKVYRHPDDIDLFTGGLSEVISAGAVVGPTFACIISKQFQSLKVGDRFWYENNLNSVGFTREQINEIKKVRLSHIMCANLDIRQIQVNAFGIPSSTNPKVGCESLPRIDLRYWGTVSPARHIVTPFNRHGKVFYTSVETPFNPVPLWKTSFLPKTVSLII